MRSANIGRTVHVLHGTTVEVVSFAFRCMGFLLGWME